MLELKNPWVLTGLIFLFSFGILVVFSFILDLTGIDTSYLSGSVFGILFVGWYYTSNFKEVMPDNLRKQVALRWAIIFTIIGFFLIIFFVGIISLFLSLLGLTAFSALFTPILYIIGVILMLILGVIEYFFTKWFLRIIGESTLKKFKK